MLPYWSFRSQAQKFWRHFKILKPDGVRRPICYIKISFFERGSEGVLPIQTVSAVNILDQTISSLTIHSALQVPQALGLWNIVSQIFGGVQ